MSGGSPAGLASLAPLAVAIVGLAVLLILVVRLVPVARQRAYDRVSAAETVRLVVALPARAAADAGLGVELIRALHPRARRGFDAWRVGWPRIELRLVWRDGSLAWEIETNRQVAALAMAQLRALYPGVAIETSDVRDQPPAATAIGRLDGPAGWPLREVAAPEARIPRALAAALEHAPAGAEVRLRCVARPVPPEAWRRDVAAAEDAGPGSVRSLIGSAIVDAVLLRPTAGSAPQAPVRLSPAEREAQARRRRGVVGFDVGLRLEVAGIAGPAAEALLWRLVHVTAELDDGRQSIRWSIRRGRGGGAPRRGSRTGSSPSCGRCPTRPSTRRGSPARARSVPRHRCRPTAWAWCSGRAAVAPWCCPPTPSPAISRCSARRDRARARSCSTSCSPWRNRRSGPRSSIPTAI